MQQKGPSEVISEGFFGLAWERMGTSRGAKPHVEPLASSPVQPLPRPPPARHRPHRRPCANKAFAARHVAPERRWSASAPAAHNGNVRHAVPGTTELIEVREADGRAANRPHVDFSGYLVTAERTEPSRAPVSSDTSS